MPAQPARVRHEEAGWSMCAVLSEAVWSDWCGGGGNGNWASVWNTSKLECCCVDIAVKQIQGIWLLSVFERQSEVSVT